jgi:hypothetical protein
MGDIYKMASWTVCRLARKVKIASWALSCVSNCTPGSRMMNTQGKRHKRCSTLRLSGPRTIKILLIRNMHRPMKAILREKKGVSGGMTEDETKMFATELSGGQEVHTQEK